jgi:hypothetical protein
MQNFIDGSLTTGNLVSISELRPNLVNITILVLFNSTGYGTSSSINNYSGFTVFKYCKYSRLSGFINQRGTYSHVEFDNVDNEHFNH